MICRVLADGHEPRWAGFQFVATGTSELEAVPLWQSAAVVWFYSVRVGQWVYLVVFTLDYKLLVFFCMPYGIMFYALMIGDSRIYAFHRYGYNA